MKTCIDKPLYQHLNLYIPWINTSTHLQTSYNPLTLRQSIMAIKHGPFIGDFHLTQGFSSHV